MDLVRSTLGEPTELAEIFLLSLARLLHRQPVCSGRRLEAAQTLPSDVSIRM